MRLTAVHSRIRTALAVFVLVLPAPLWASDTPHDRATLKGITQVVVLMGDILPEAEGDGLSRSQLQIDVTLRLRQSGINVVSPSSSSATGYLYVHVRLAKSTGALSYAFYLNVEFHQAVQLLRDPMIIHAGAPTWSSSTIGMVRASRLPDLRSRVLKQVNMFINAYLEQNPRK